MDEEIREIHSGLSEDLEHPGIKAEPKSKNFVEQIKGALIRQKDNNVVNRVRLRYLYRVKLTPSEKSLHFYDINGVKIVIAWTSHPQKISSVPKNLSVDNYLQFFPNTLYIQGIPLRFYKRVKEVVRKRLEKNIISHRKEGPFPGTKSGVTKPSLCRKKRREDIGAFK